MTLPRQQLVEAVSNVQRAVSTKSSVPALEGILLNAAESRHGIILAKNEAAKKYGIQTAETIWQARQKCPRLLLAPPHRGYLLGSILFAQCFGQLFHKKDMVENSPAGGVF